MEGLVTFDVPEVTPLFAADTLMDLAGTTTIGVRLVAVSTIVTEVLIMRAALPANGTNSAVTCLTEGEAKRAVLLLVLGAR